MGLVRILFFLLLFCGRSSAATYYVTNSGSGTLTGASCTDARSVSWFNTNAMPGDTANLCQGSYSTTLTPARSGTFGNPIAYRRDPAAPEWSVILSLSGTTYGADLTARSHIIYDGIYFRTMYGSIWMDLGASNNIVRSCRFKNPQRSIRIRGDAQNNRIEGSLFELGEDAVSQAASFGRWDSDCINRWNTGASFAGTDCNGGTRPRDHIYMQKSRGTVIENNILYECTHGAIYAEYEASYGIIRNNTVYNTFHGNVYVAQSHGPWLIEGNFTRQGGYRKQYNPDHRDREQILGTGLRATSRAIIRNNVSRDADYGLSFGCASWGCSTNSAYYHNTFYNNWWQVFHSSSNQADYTNIHIKNNIFLNDSHILASRYFPFSHRGQDIFKSWSNYADSPYQSILVVENNLFSPGTNTIYYKNTYTTPRTLAQVKSTYPSEWLASNFEANVSFVDLAADDFRLQKTATAAIDAGSFLTNITAKSGDVITVANSYFFFDGWSIPGEVGDTIYNASGAAAVIQSIDHSNHRITLNDAGAFSVGQGITTIALVGSAPDLGAFEYGANPKDPPPLGARPRPPSGLRIQEE